MLLHSSATPLNNQPQTSELCQKHGCEPSNPGLATVQVLQHTAFACFCTYATQPHTTLNQPINSVRQACAWASRAENKRWPLQHPAIWIESQQAHHYKQHRAQHTKLSHHNHTTHLVLPASTIINNGRSTTNAQKKPCSSLNQTNHRSKLLLHQPPNP